MTREPRPGFADPVHDAQRVFRAVLDALARPGHILPLGVDLPSPPTPLSSELAAVALALADADAPLWLDPRLAAAEEVGAYLRFHTGAPIAARPEQASFALLSEPGLAPPLEAFAQGTHEYPDRSATLVIAVERLTGGAGATLLGPGIRGTSAFGPGPLPPDLIAQLRVNHDLFPLGVDCLFVAAGQVLGLPRSSELREAA